MPTTISRRTVSRWALALALGLAAGPALAKDKVVSIMTSAGYLYLGPLVAEQMGFFAAEDITPEIIFSEGGSKALAAVIGGDAQVYVGAVSSGFRAREKGTDIQTVGASLTQYASNVVVSKKWAEKNGLTASSSYQDRLKALKGGTFGMTSAGSGTDQLLRFLAKQGGLRADKEMTITALGAPETMLAALGQNRIDGFSHSSPTGETAVHDLGAMMLFNLTKGEVKDLDGFLYIGFMIKESWAKKNPALMVRYLRALQKSFDAIHDDAQNAKARELVRVKYHPKTDKALFEEVWEDTRAAFPKTVEVNEGMIKRVADFLAEFDKPVDANTLKSGVGWTDEYAQKTVASFKK